MRILENILKGNMRGDSMGNREFQKLCINTLINYCNKMYDVTDKATISEDDVFVVWYCKTLQNHKALLSTTIPDGMYYEFTYNGDKQELYMDAYKKWQNVCYNVDDCRYDE